VELLLVGRRFRGVLLVLRPEIINGRGFDTGFSISNVSLNPFGAAPQAGDGILHFYGANAPGSIDSSGKTISTAMLRISTIGAGATYTGLVSTIAPFFSGYIIAECNFSPARGFAMITDLGAQKIASGYLAEVMERRDAPPNSRGPGASQAG
jgi:hypothetical protein